MIAWYWLLLAFGVGVFAGLNWMAWYVATLPDGR
jgi:hypothetical protein